MSYTQSDYDKLCRAISSGTRQVRFADRTVEYRSLDEMVRVKNMMARELGIARRPNRTVGTFQKGLAK